MLSNSRMKIFLAVGGLVLVAVVVSADREISEADVQDVIKNAKTINLPAQNHVIHAIRQHFLVDGQDGITNPVGMLGSRVEVDVHVVHGNLNRLQNAIRAVKGLQLDVDDIVFNGLASSLALLTNDFIAGHGGIAAYPPATAWPGLRSDRRRTAATTRSAGDTQSPKRIVSVGGNANFVPNNASDANGIEEANRR